MNLQESYDSMIFYEYMIYVIYIVILIPMQKITQQHSALWGIAHWRYMACSDWVVALSYASMISQDCQVGFAAGIQHRTRIHRDT